jgi:uncharacterized phage protein gp47/JayE
MPYPYTPPEHLQGQTVDLIHQRMLEFMPNDIDKSELQFPWDFTRPSAIEKSFFIEFELNETVQIMFPHWAYRQWLDRHAELEGLTRRVPNPAYGYVEITGRQGTVVAQGFQFATPSNLTPSVLFEAVEEITLDGDPDPETGLVTVSIPIRAIEGGTSGNVPPDTIILMVRPDSNITYVTNTEATSGGTAEETDDQLRERILEIKRDGISFTGCDADYVRWAREVPGVGNAVTEAEWAGPGTVRLFVIDGNGLPANQQILDAVYNHIISPQNRIERKAPIGATLTVAAPAPIYVDIEATVVLVEGEVLATVTDRFKTNLDAYWLQATTENDVFDVQSGVAQNKIKFVFVGSTLANTAGIVNYDHNTLLVNGGTADIVINTGTFPVTREVILSE